MAAVHPHDGGDVHLEVGGKLIVIRCGNDPHTAGATEIHLIIFQDIEGIRGKGGGEAPAFVQQRAGIVLIG